MGYEYHLSSWNIAEDGELVVKVENRGVAPFYQDWPVELEVTRGGKTRVIEHSGLLAGILPGQGKEWHFEGCEGAERLRLRVPNPMDGGKALRFANKEQGQVWLELKN